MKIRKLLSTLTVGLVALSLAACGGDPAPGTSEPAGTNTGSGSQTTDPGTEGTQDASAPEGEVLMWMYPVIADEGESEAFWSEQEAKFEDAYPGVDLQIELRGWANRDEQLATALSAGEGPDLVYLIPDQLGQYVATGGLAPIDDLVSGFVGDIRDTALAAATVDGQLYGVPVLQTSTVMAWNKAAFEAAGINELPETWDEIKAAAPALAENGVAVLGYAGTTTLNLSFFPLLWQAGGSIFTEDGSDVAFNSPEGVEALQFLLDLQEIGGLPEDAAVSSGSIEEDQIISGSAAMVFNFEDFRTEPVGAAIGEDNLVLGGALEGREKATYGTVGMISRTSTRDNDAAVGAALEFFGTAEFSSEFNEVGRRLPARVDVEMDFGDPVFVDALDYVIAGEPHPFARQVQGVLTPHIQAALQGQVTAQQALDAAADEARSMMG